jgi:Rieske 2Fe-2S family protein
MLPRDAYVSNEVFAWEQRHIFGGTWTCIGRSGDLAQSGDQRADSIGQSGVLIVRDGAGSLHAFANACRHRGHELHPCGAAVNRPILVCPYHSWRYHLDGSLLRAPGFEGSDFEPAEHSLVELRLANWHGWLFLNTSGTAPPLESQLAGLDQLVTPYEPERLITRGRHEYVVASNWKVLNENYQECYHCPIIHPELCKASPPASGANYSHDSGAWVGGWMDLRDGWATMSLDGSTSATVLRGVMGSLRRQVVYLGVFPNVLISLHPDYVMTHRLTPLSARRTRIECEWHFSPEDVERDGFDPSFAVDFWDITNRQDWLACESVQRGLSSPHAVPGPLSESEDGVYQYVTMVARCYLGQDIVPAAPAHGSQ